MLRAMTDLEITKACAEAMGYELVQGCEDEVRIHFIKNYGRANGPGRPYDPLHDDAQAMALVKKFHLELTCGLNDIWIASNRGTTDYVSGNNSDLNRAICECICKMHRKKRAHCTYPSCGCEIAWGGEGQPPRTICPR